MSPTGIYTRTEKHSMGGLKYSHNKEFFANWSKESAYILGYLEADGSFNWSTPSVTIRFATSVKDEVFLRSLKNCIEHTGSIKYLEHKLRNGKTYTGCYFVVVSRKWKDFLKQNVRTGHIPDMPKEYLPHYIRGYFDGDGSIYTEKELHRVTFVFANESLGQEILASIGKTCGKTKGMVLHKRSNANCWSFRIATQKNVTSFGNWIYRDASIFLSRKRVRFLPR